MESVTMIKDKSSHSRVDGHAAASSNSNFTVKTCLAELNLMSVEFKKALRGYRRQQYETMERAQRMIVRLRQNKDLCRDFVRTVKKSKKESAGGKPRRQKTFSLATEVVALATGAQSRQARQVAWKRARVLNYLRETGVKVGETAKAIEAQGGIEKIFSSAVAAKKTGPDKKVNGSHPTKSPGSIVKTSTLAQPSNSNDREIIVPVWMRLSDRDEIGDLQIGSRITMSAIRVGQKSADFKITRVDLPSKEVA
jgi:hypothetical protein